MSSGEREMLAAAIKGKPDNEIAQFVEAMGGEAFLDQTFEGMRKALNPDRAQNAVIGYELAHGSQTLNYALVVRDRAATVEKRALSDARVTLRLSTPNYLRLITGQLPPVRAVLTRKLRIKGDRKFARSMQSMFEN